MDELTPSQVVFGNDLILVHVAGYLSAQEAQLARGINRAFARAVDHVAVHKRPCTPEQFFVTKKNRGNVSKVFQAGVRSFVFTSFKVPCPTWFYTTLETACSLPLRALSVKVWRNSYTDVHNMHHDSRVSRYLSDPALAGALQRLYLDIMAISLRDVDLRHLRALREVHVTGWNVNLIVPEWVRSAHNSNGFVESGGRANFTHISAKMDIEGCCALLGSACLEVADVRLSGGGVLHALAGSRLTELKLDAVACPSIECDLSFVRPLKKLRVSAYTGLMTFRGPRIDHAWVDGSTNDSAGAVCDFKGTPVGRLECVSEDLCRLRGLRVDVLVVNVYDEHVVVDLPDVCVTDRMIVAMHFGGEVGLSNGLGDKFVLSKTKNGVFGRVDYTFCVMDSNVVNGYTHTPTQKASRPTQAPRP